MHFSLESHPWVRLEQLFLNQGTFASPIETMNRQFPRGTLLLLSTSEDKSRQAGIKAELGEAYSKSL